VRRRRLLWIGIPGLAAVLLFAIFFLLIFALSFCVGGPGYYSDKYSPAAPAHPTALPAVFRPEEQTEPHTCGLHALSSLYAAYSLDPRSLRLRFRLGVDKPFSNFIPDSLGTIHPDMLRVLHQDGFDTELLLPGSENTKSLLESHLDAGNSAITLITVHGEMHWVVLTARHDDKVVVCDSLRAELYEEPLAGYLTDRVYSLVLVKAKRDDTHR
jgi:hypothetical protein